MAEKLPAPSAEHFLHPNEQKHLKTLLTEKAQQCFLLSRQCAKEAISILKPDVLPTEIDIKKGVFGFPFIPDIDGESFGISLTHTGTRSAAVFYPEAHPVSIDLEEINPEKCNIISQYISPSEMELFSQYALTPAEALTSLWTVKEALSKALRCGLMMNFNHIVVNKTYSKTILEQQAIVSTFTDYQQYKAITFFCFDRQAICSLVIPIKTNLFIG